MKSWLSGEVAEAQKRVGGYFAGRAKNLVKKVRTKPALGMEGALYYDNYDHHLAKPGGFA